MKINGKENWIDFESEISISISNIEYHYIHGKADINHNTESSDIVLGIDEYLPNDEKNSNIEFIQFKKFYQRIYKKTGSDYKKWIKNNNYSHNLYFVGHSLDVTDKDILRELILKDNVNEVTIYHHNQEALSSQIANLVKVIGQDRLIDLTGKEVIKFEQLKA